MRDQRHIRMQAGPLPSGRTIEWILPDTEITTRALKLVPEQTRQNPAAAIQQAQSNQLRLCLKKIGEEPVTYSDLQGSKLDGYFAPTELDLVEEAFNRSVRPTDREARFFDAHLEQFKGDEGEWRWRSKILLGEDLEQFKDAEARVEKLEGARRRGDLKDDEALEEARETRDRYLDEEALEIEGRPLDSEMTRLCTESVPRKWAGDPAMTAKLAQDMMARQVIESINGSEVSTADLKGMKLDEALHPKEQHIVIEGVSDLSTPERDEVDDFLSTMETV